MAKTQLPEHEQIWVWDNYRQLLYLAEVNEIARAFRHENDPERYFAITINPKTNEIQLKPITAARETKVHRDLALIKTVLGQCLACTTDSELLTYEQACSENNDGSVSIADDEPVLTTVSAAKAEEILSPQDSDIFAKHFVTSDDGEWAYLIASYLLYGEQTGPNQIRIDAATAFDPKRFRNALVQVTNDHIKEPGIERFDDNEPMRYVFDLPEPYANCIFAAYGQFHANKTLQPDQMKFATDLYQKMSLSSPLFMRQLVETVWELDQHPVFRNRYICQQIMLCHMLYDALTPKITPRVNIRNKLEYVMSYDDVTELPENVTPWAQKVKIECGKRSNSAHQSVYELDVKDNGNFLTDDCIFAKS